MSRKTSQLLVASVVILATLACSFGQAANDPAAAQQAILDQIPGPLSGQPQADTTYVGQVADSQTYIALVVQKDTAVVYICDGGDTWEWFGGSIIDGKLDVTSEKGNHLVATVAADSVTGTLALSGGQPLAFAAQPAIEGQTGLYRHKADKDGVTYSTGWIITANGVRGETTTPNGQLNGLNITVAVGQPQQTLLRIRSDDKEYTIAKDGIGFNLHNFSILELPVPPGQNDFDYFCNDTKFFAGGIVIPEGHILTVDLVADGCQAVAAPAEPAPPPAPPTIPEVPPLFQDPEICFACNIP